MGLSYFESAAKNKRWLCPSVVSQRLPAHERDWIWAARWGILTECCGKGEITPSSGTSSGLYGEVDPRPGQSVDHTDRCVTAACESLKWEAAWSCPMAMWGRKFQWVCLVLAKSESVSCGSGVDTVTGRWTWTILKGLPAKWSDSRGKSRVG